MSTNYYARTADTVGEGVHIGKYSGGWDFLFRAHPEASLVDCEAWHSYLSRPSVRIVDEYGVDRDLTEFWVMATRKGERRTHANEWRYESDSLAQHYRDKRWTDSHGHPFAAYEFC